MVNGHLPRFLRSWRLKRTARLLHYIIYIIYYIIQTFVIKQITVNLIGTNSKKEVLQVYHIPIQIE